MSLNLSPNIVSSQTNNPSPPILTFRGTANFSQIEAIDQSGQEIARYLVQGTKPSTFTISQTLGPNTPQSHTGTVKKSQLTGSTKLLVHDQEYKLSHTLDSTSEVWVLKDTPVGTLTWRAKSEGEVVLEDDHRQILAKGSTDLVRLEILVQSSEVVLDIVLTSWASIIRSDMAHAGEAKKVLDVYGALLAT